MLNMFKTATEWRKRDLRCPNAVVKAACMESRRSRVRFKEAHVSSPLTSKDSILWGASVTER